MPGNSRIPAGKRTISGVVRRPHREGSGWGLIGVIALQPIEAQLSGDIDQVRLIDLIDLVGHSEAAELFGQSHDGRQNEMRLGRGGRALQVRRVDFEEAYG